MIMTTDRLGVSAEEVGADVCPSINRRRMRGDIDLRTTTCCLHVAAY
jgi:hypothetical protein